VDAMVLVMVMMGVVVVEAHPAVEMKMVEYLLKKQVRQGQIIMFRIPLQDMVIMEEEGEMTK